MVKAVVGANWGDEGKGKITDMLAKEADIIVRFQGGANAGHTIVNDYGKFALHTSTVRCILRTHHKHDRQWCRFKYSGTYERDPVYRGARRSEAKDFGFRPCTDGYALPHSV